MEIIFTELKTVIDKELINVSSQTPLLKSLSAMLIPVIRQTLANYLSEFLAGPLIANLNEFYKANSNDILVHIDDNLIFKTKDSL